jgi:hypothetical protein
MSAYSYGCSLKLTTLPAFKGFLAGCVVGCSTTCFGRSDMEDFRSLKVNKL